MVYQINWAPAVDDIRSIDKETRKRIIKKVGSILGQPSRFVERLEGYPFFKLRVGDYRVILDIRNTENIIVVVLVGHRSKVYQGLRRRMS